MAFWEHLGNIIADSWDPVGLFHQGSYGADGSGTSLADLWDKFKNGRANDINYKIAQDNLDYQRERNEIEDARYEDETAYNRAFQEDERAYQRAFAEDERAYNRALQERLFEREDTAIERQVQSLSKLGINPLGQNLSGLGAGQALQSSAPVGASAPDLSGRGGSTLHNNFQMIPGGVEGALSAVSGLASTVNGVATGQYQRDSLALENDRKYLENLILANKYNIKYDGPMTTYGVGNNYRNSRWVQEDNGKPLYDRGDFSLASGSELNKEYETNRELSSKRKHGVFDWESPQTKLLKSLGTLDFQSLAENLLTNVAKSGNWLNSNLKDFSKDMENNAIMNFIKKFFAF